ncbi:hypothetical protein [Alistipes putredinis]
MTIFKKGQRVWWNDPICEESGEYEVLDSQDEINADKSENERIIRIGDGENTWDIPADYLTIVCPISDEDRQQLKQQEYRNRLRDKELTEHIRKLVVQFEDQNFKTPLRPNQRRIPRRLLRVRIPSERRCTLCSVGLRRRQTADGTGF